MKNCDIILSLNNISQDMTNLCQIIRSWISCIKPKYEEKLLKQLKKKNGFTLLGFAVNDCHSSVNHSTRWYKFKHEKRMELDSLKLCIKNK